MAKNEKHWYSTTGESFDPRQYPRTYEASAGWKVFQYLVGALFAIGGVIGILFFANRIGSRDFGVLALMVAVFLTMAVFGVYALLAVARSKTVLLADSIEVYGVTGVQKLRRNQIAGWRFIRAQKGASVLVLEPLDQNLKKIRISQTIRQDNAFRAWIESLPDLDANELKQEEEAIAADESLGATPEERLARLASARRIARWLTWFAYGSMVVLILPPQHRVLPVLCALAVIPWLVFILQVSSPRLYSLDTRKNQARAGLSAPLFLPGLALALCALNGAHLVDWRPAVVLAAIAVVTMGGIALIVDPVLRQRKSSTIVLMLLMGAYGYGVGVAGDIVTDQSVPQVFHVSVLGKHVVHGKHTSWDVRLSPWGPVQQAGDVSVSRSFYDSVSAGDTICTNLRRGSIGIEWYTVTNCY